MKSKSDVYKRDAPRIFLANKNISIYYKFSSIENSSNSIENSSDFVDHVDTIYKGRILDICNGGAQIVGPIPSLKYLKLLGEEKLYIACNIAIDSMLKVLARVRWAESCPAEGSNFHRIGLQFLKITESSKLKLNNFIVRHQLTLSKSNRRDELLNPDN